MQNLIQCNRKQLVGGWGLRQGDVVSPMILNIALEQIVKHWLILTKESNLKFKNKQINLITYSDDIVYDILDRPPQWVVFLSVFQNGSFTWLGYF